MAKVSKADIITSIDVGTTKICVLIARAVSQERVEILGVGRSASDGLKKGVVVDIAKTISSISTAVAEAELMAGVKVESASIGISGAHISSINSTGVVPIKRGEITQDDINNAIASAQAIPIAQGQQILHILPQYFIIDGQDRIHDPLGMHGIRLEVQTHIILGATTSVQNLVKCCERAGIAVEDIVLEQLASAQAVLSYDERQLGVAVLDIGGGTADLAIYQDGSICHTKVIPVAGNHFTNDIAVGLHTTLTGAEQIKKEHGLVTYYAFNDQLIEIDTAESQSCTRSIYQHELVEILRPRARELLSLVHKDIVHNHMKSRMTTGLVITGGGSLLAGIDELAHEILRCNVRIGNPHQEFDLPVTLRNPMYATGYGILIYCMKKRHADSMNTLNGPLMMRVLERMKSWALDFF